ncbi:hypothetical protein IMSAGC017_01808 [Thomasclavelia cocleata]|uniref:Uncharacterized protein n=1 Tax=Thomasclavelia cocleata TaxID=69824 RepID=A0A829ZBH7_9FIRM|nr:hypothetical protein IMSAGC017_01808 [Thomasclavelia cocleata]
MISIFASNPRLGEYPLISVFPLLIAVTRPSSFTVAIDSSLDVNLKSSGNIASIGLVVYSIWYVAPSYIAADSLLKTILVATCLGLYIFAYDTCISPNIAAAFVFPVACTLI